MAQKGIKVRGINIRFSADLSQLIEDFQKIRSASTATAKKLNDVNKLLKLDPKNTTLLNQKFKYLGKAIDETKQKIELARQTMEKLKKQQGVEDVTEQLEALERQIIEDTNYLKTLQKEFNQFSIIGEKIKATGQAMQDFGQKIRNVGTAITTSISMPLYMGLRQLVTMANEAETSYMKVYTIAEEMSKNNALTWDRLRYTVRDASDETGVAIQDFNEALYQTISASVDTADAVDYTTNAIKLARGGFTSTERAVDIMTTIMNAYAMSADRTTEVMDRLIATQNYGKTTVDKMSYSLGRVIPSASMAHVNLDNVSTSMAVLTKRGIQTRIAATSLRSLFDEINKTGSRADDALKEMTNKGFSELIDSGKSMTEILQMLSDYAEEAGMSLNDMFGNVRSRMAAASIMTDGGKEYNRILKEMENSAGAAERAFQKMNATPAVKMQIALNKLKNVGIEIGSDLLPMITEGLEDLNKLVKAYQKLNPKQKKFAQLLAITGVAAGPVLTGLGTFVWGTGKLTEGLGSLIGSARLIPGLLAPIANGFRILAGSLSGVLAAAAPVAVAVAAAAAAGIAIGLILKKTGALDGLNSRTQDLMESGKKLNDLTKDINQTVSETKGIMSQTASETATSAAASERLVEELNELSQKENKTIDDTRRMKVIVGQLNSIFPELNLSINTTTSELSMTNDELVRFVKESNAAAKAAAFEETLEEAYTNLFEAQKKVIDAEDEYNKILEDKKGVEKELKQLHDALTDIDSDWVEVNGEMVNYSARNAELTREVAQFNKVEQDSAKKLQEAKDAVTAIESEIENYQDVMLGAEKEAKSLHESTNKLFTPQEIVNIQKLTLALDEARKRMADGTGTIQEVIDAQNALAEATGDNTKIIVEEWEALTQEQQNTVSAFAESFSDMYADLSETVSKSLSLFDEFDKGTEMSFETMIQNLDGQVKGLHQWEQDIQSLIDKNLPQSLIDEFIQLGPSSANMVHELATATPQQLEELESAWNEKINAMTFADDLGTHFKEDLASNLAEGFEGVPELLAANGYDVVMGLAQGISDNLELAAEAAEELGDTVIDEIEDATEVQSPSKATQRVGSYLDQGLALGINNGKGSVKTALALLFNAMNIMGMAAQKRNEAINAGAMIASGLASGIASGRSSVINAATSMAQAAADSAKATLKINSPSKVFEDIGLGTGEGMVKGIAESLAPIANAMSGMVNAAVPQIPQSTTNNSIVLNMNVTTQPGQNNAEIANYTSNYILQKMKAAGAVWA